MDLNYFGILLLKYKDRKSILSPDMYFCECKNGNLETITDGTTLTQIGSDQGGGVGGVNYAEYSDGSELNYKTYNLRRDVIATYGSDKSLLLCHKEYLYENI